jgi:hypothetical protein
MNRDVDLLDEKRDSIYQMWVKCENLNDIYENHHSREWLDNHCMVRDLSEMIPDDIDVLEERDSGCIELFQDFDSTHHDQNTGERIAIGEAWDYTTWVGEGCDGGYGSFEGLDTALTHAIQHAREMDRPIVRYSSITLFDNITYRERYIH